MTILMAIEVRQSIMATTANKKKYKSQFARRLRQIREDAGLTQADVAAALGIPPGHYAKFEIDDGTRIMPHEYISQFCLVTGEDAWRVLTGRPKPQT